MPRTLKAIQPAPGPLLHPRIHLRQQFSWFMLLPTSSSRVLKNSLSCLLAMLPRPVSAATPERLPRVVFPDLALLPTAPPGSSSRAGRSGGACRASRAEERVPVRRPRLIGPDAGGAGIHECVRGAEGGADAGPTAGRPAACCPCLADRGRVSEDVDLPCPGSRIHLAILLRLVSTGLQTDKSEHLVPVPLYILPAFAIHD